MLFIGITGGVGAGKTAILEYLKLHYNCRVMLADEIAHRLMEPGAACYGRIRELFAEEAVFLPDGRVDRPAMAAALFSDDGKREALNRIVHPAVREYVIEQAETERQSGKLDLLILEAALLIEEHYDAVCDELWYIYTSGENRRARLKANRGYSDEKIDRIFASQMPEEVFCAHCAEEIDNNGSPEEAFARIDHILQKKKIRRE